MLRNTLTVLGLGLLVLSPVAKAAIVTIDPDGLAGINNPVQVGSIDFLPGNALNQNAINVADPTSVPAQFTNYYQARLGSLLDQNGNVIQVAGLNSTFEITIVSQFDLTPSIYQDQFNNLITTTALAPQTANSVNYFQIYYDSKMNANDLSGVGFNDGTLIMSGSISFFGGSFVEFGVFPKTLLDQFGANDWGNTLSNTGVGGSAVTAEVSYVNTDFFSSNIQQMNFNTTNAEPYNQINPSKSFINGIIPNIGAINGQTGPDIIVQGDAVASFVVPEPGVFMLMGISSLGLFLRRRK